MPFFVLLGESSYSLYILQLPIYYIYTNIISIYIFRNLEISSDGYFYIFIFLLIALSIASFYAIEKPGKKIILNINKHYL